MTAGSLKVVFDTNILISGHFWKGPPYRCMLAIDAGLATLVLSDPILTEFGEKLTGKFGASKSDVDPIVEHGLPVRRLLRSKGRRDGCRRIPTMTSSSRRHSSAGPQSLCQGTITSWSWAKSKGSRS